MSHLAELCEPESSASRGLRLVARLLRQLQAGSGVRQAHGTSIKVSTAGSRHSEEQT